MRKPKCFFLDCNRSSMAAKNRLGLLISGFEENGFEAAYQFIIDPKCSKIKILSRIIASLRIINSLRKNDVLFVYGEIYFPFLLAIAQLRGVKILTERTEYPANVLFPENVNYKSNILIHFYKRCLKKVDVFVTCSSSLKEYYRQYTKRQAKFVIIPFLIDLSKFRIQENIESKKTITYCGYMGGNKDGVENIIKIFCRSEFAYRNFNLVLIGSADEKDFIQLKDLAKKKDPDNKIIFTGRLPHQDVINHLMTSTLHILARVDNIRSRGGFPSKLAEYLATGKPSIVTDVGDISKYFKDGENIFLTPPGENEFFVKKLNKILMQSEALKRVGENGRSFVEKYTPVKQVKALMNEVYAKK